MSGHIAIAAKAAQTSKALVERFRSAGATSFHAAVDPGPMDRWQQRAFDALKKAGAVHEANPGKWYLREDALKDMQSAQVRVAVLAIGAALAAALIGILVSALGR
jgi:hypothetical protein